MTEFQPGEYTTRDGHEAIVEFRMREPTNTVFVLVGQVFCEGEWRHKSWTLNGRVIRHSKHALDLMPPCEVTYRRLPCPKHDKDMPWRELSPASSAFAVLQSGWCQDCQWERITRRDGNVIKLELVPQEDHDEA